MSAARVHLLDQLDAAMAELGHWFATGERVECERCDQLVPAAALGLPVRHQMTWAMVQPTLLRLPQRALRTALRALLPRLHRGSP